MDLTSLSSNLPRNGPHSEEPAEDEEPASTVLMAAFKQAASSVTHLYRTANEQVDRARRDGQRDGYQDCLDDLFTLLSRLEGKADPTTRETIRQWALGKRRKLGPRSARRDDRESSSESDVDHNSCSSPVHQSQIHEDLPSQAPTEPERIDPPQMPQVPIFTFQAHHVPRHVPSPPETTDLELPDNDSPPPSPVITPQHNMFQQTKNFGGHGTNVSRGRHHNRSRVGNKRRYDSIDDFFELAGLEKMRMGKKGRYQ